MCRMIAAAGDVDPGALRAALVLMATNENPIYTHEKRSRGADYRHEDGWGAAWIEDGVLRVYRTPHSCLQDPSISAVDTIRTNLMFLHARRASPRGTVRLQNSHPFLLVDDGRAYAFCHNGVVRDKSSLKPKAGLKPQGGTDSELLFLHVLRFLDPDDPAGSMLRSYEEITAHSALHSFLATTDRIIAAAKRNPAEGLPGYHALWEGRGPNLHVVSSEPVEGLGVEDWTRVPEPGTVTLKPGE